MLQATTAMKPRSVEPSVRSVLERWAWWRRAGRLGAEVSWPKKSLTGKFMDGIRGIQCHACNGRGKIQSARFRIDHLMLVCPTCEGQGSILLDKHDPKKANPGFIRSTYRGHEDDVMVLTDRLVCQLGQNVKTQKHHCVLWAEYVSHKYEIQEWKAAKMGISYVYFKKLLHEAHMMIEQGLEDGNVRFETTKKARRM